MIRTTVGIILLATSIAQAQLSLRPVALDGQPVPGQSGTFVGLVNSLNLLTINNSGQVAFGKNTGASGTTGSWSEGTGVLHQPVLGTNYGNPTTGYSFPQIDDAGRYNITKSYPSASGIFREFGNVLTPSALLDSQPTPGSIPPTSFSQIGNNPQFFSAPSANRSGAMSLYAQFTQQSGTKYGVLVNTPDGVNRVVATQGSLAPGTSNTFSSFGLISFDTDGSIAAPNAPSVNSAGKAAFVANAGGPGVWSETPQGLTLAAKSGNVAPGIPSATFTSFTDLLSIGPVGQVAFRATSTAARGVWSNGSGSLHLVAREQTSIVGLNGSETLNKIGVPALSREGRAVFLSSINTTGSFPHGMWAEDGQGSLKLLVRSGMQVPGAPAGTLFTNISAGYPFILPTEQFGVPLINARNHVVFSSGQGIWMSDLDGSLTPLARVNDMIPVDGVPRRILSVALSCYGGNGDDGRSSCLNDNDQIALLANVQGVGSGVYVLNIPEPGSLSLLAIGLVCLVRRSRISR